VLTAKLGIAHAKADQLIRGYEEAERRIDEDFDTMPPPKVLWKVGLIATHRDWKQRLFDELFDLWTDNKITARQMLATIEDALARAQKVREDEQSEKSSTWQNTKRRILWRIKLRSGLRLLSMSDGTVLSRRTFRPWRRVDPLRARRTRRRRK
jgi:hypothetical protein